MSEVEKHMMQSLKYTPEDGKIRWLKCKGRPVADGAEAGNVTQKGYRKLKFFGKQYSTHRVAWLLHYGCWPVGDIDHIDGNKINNRIENLRDVTHRVNMQNRTPAAAKNQTGFLGVVKRGSKYAAHAHKKGKQIYLGLFETAELAHKSYKENT